MLTKSRVVRTKKVSTRILWPVKAVGMFTAKVSHAAFDAKACENAFWNGTDTAQRYKGKNIDYLFFF